MLNSYGCAQGIKYEKYSSLDPELNIAMDYISGWNHIEQRGSLDSFAQVIFYEPRKKNKAFKASIVLTVEKSSKVEFQPKTIEAMAEDLLAKRLKFGDAEVLSKLKKNYFKTKAIDIQLRYKTLDELYSVNAKLMPLKERVIIFKRADKFYTLRYSNAEEDFAKFDSAFTHIISTLRFKD